MTPDGLVINQVYYLPDLYGFDILEFIGNPAHDPAASVFYNIAERRARKLYGHEVGLLCRSPEEAREKQKSLLAGKLNEIQQHGP